LNEQQRPLVTTGVVLGIGLGGFLDGILFHQLLQLHNMLTGKIPKDSIANVEINMFWDGMFHAVTWMTTCAGVAMLFRTAKRRDVVLSAPTFAGALAIGWGMFNFVEGVIDHHVLGLHHVVERLGVSMYDWAFLASGIVLTIGGWLVVRRDPERS
jgi:uncharacterized membrane protein